LDVDIMKNELNVHQVLKVFQKIIAHGTERQGVHHLDGITADSGFDGYTVTLSDQDVTLTLQFHNSYHLSSKNQIAEQAFFEKITQIDRKSYA